MQKIKKIVKSIQIYSRYFHRASTEIYLYYTSPWPIHMLFKKWALANRAIRVLWAPPSPGRKPLDQKTINLKLLFINVTCSPHFDWVAQQFKNAFFDLDDYPSLCICDRDQIFEGRFERMLKASPSSPRNCR